VVVAGKGRGARACRRGRENQADVREVGGREKERREGSQSTGRVHVEAALLQHGRPDMRRQARDRPEGVQRWLQLAARLCSAMSKPGRRVVAGGH